MTELNENVKEYWPQISQLKEKFVIVTIHDACPSFSTIIFKLADELEKLKINFNIALIPFFNEKEDLPRFPDFVEKIKSYKNCEIAMHGLYHERRNREFVPFVVLLVPFVIYFLRTCIMASWMSPLLASTCSL